MDKKVFVAVAVCAGVYLLWYSLNAKKFEEYRAYQQQQQTEQVQETANAAETKAAPVAKKATPKIPDKKLVVDKVKKPAPVISNSDAIVLGEPGYRVHISPSGGVVTRVDLPEYKGKRLDGLEELISTNRQLELTSVGDWSYLATVTYKVKEQTRTPEGHEKLVLHFSDENVSIIRSYVLNTALFSIDSDVDVHFKKQPPSHVYVGLQALKEVEANSNERRELFYNKKKEQDYYTVGGIDELTHVQGDFRWFGFSSRYFLNGLVERGSQVRPTFLINPIGQNRIASYYVYPVSGDSMRIPLTMYYGPKDINILGAVGNKLEMAVDFGYFTVLAVPLLKLLKWFYQYVHNFGLAIILLTILVKIALYPLTYKSMKSMKEMQRIQPQLAKLREKYKNDKEKLNKEMLGLMRSNGYNPMSGCFPILIQMPIFIALYNVLWGALELYGQPFAFWLNDLSLRDPYYVMPVLLAGTMFIQQKLTPNTATDPAQQKMMMMMPVIFGFMMLWLPSGLTLYMLVNTVVSVLQQLFINRSLGDRQPKPTVVTA